MTHTEMTFPRLLKTLRALLLLAAVVLVALLLLAWQRVVSLSRALSVSASAELPQLLDDSVVSFRVEFGVTDVEPAVWDGSLSVEGGEALDLRNWHPRPDDKIVGKDRWALSTRKGQNFRRRAWEEELLTAPEPYLLTAGIVADVKANSGTNVEIKTKSGEFQFRPFELQPGKPVSFLGGRVAVDRVPTGRLLSTAECENDFASISSGPTGELWTAWVAYRDGANQVLARRFDGKAWGPPVAVTERPGDIFLVKLARDRHGNLWAVWSARVGANWDLYARRFNGKSWLATTRLTDDPQPDIYHDLAMDSNGNLWVVWQGFRSGKSDIFARRYDGSAWSEAERVTSSDGNDWEPAIAADGVGRVYVAWDTYSNGNYDVVMRRFEKGSWSQPIVVAATPKFEAHVSLACDGQGRLWAAWNESGMQWGKDTGFLVKKEGTRLYQWRTVALAVYAGGAWQEPAAGFESSLSPDLRGYNDLPILQSDGRGRVWLFFRHRLLRVRDTPSGAAAHRGAWEIFGTSYEGDRWLTPVAIPFSQGRMDMRGGFASDGQGNVYAAWASDNRDFEGFLFQHADVYAARIPRLDRQAVPPRLTPKIAPELSAFPIHPKEAEDLARMRSYEIRSGEKTYRIYRGDVHRHTEFSMDGNNDGSMLQTYRYAVDAASLDFLGVTDHNGSGGPDVEYISWLQQQMADLFLLPNAFTPFFSYERSVSYPNGHRNVVFAERGNPTLPIPGEEQKATAGAKALYEYLRRYRGVAISHTSASNMGTDWRDNDPEVEPLVEIYQGDRVSAEYEGAPKRTRGGLSPQFLDGRATRRRWPH